MFTLFESVNLMNRIYIPMEDGRNILTNAVGSILPLSSIKRLSSLPLLSSTTIISSLNPIKTLLLAAVEKEPLICTVKSLNRGH